MARVRIALDVVADKLFGFAEYPVSIDRIEHMAFDPYVTFEIYGRSVPICDDADVEINVSQNRAGERLHRMKFVARGDTNDDS